MFPGRFSINLEIDLGRFVIGKVSMLIIERISKKSY